MNMQGTKREELVINKSLSEKNSKEDSITNKNVDMIARDNQLELMTYTVDARFIKDGRPYTIKAPREQWPDCINGIARHLGADWQDRYPNFKFLDYDDKDEKVYTATFKSR